MPDITIENHGSILLMQPLTAAARAWIDEHVDEHLSWGDAVVVEPRYIGPLVDAMRRDGLEVRG